MSDGHSRETGSTVPPSFEVQAARSRGAFAEARKAARWRNKHRRRRRMPFGNINALRRHKMIASFRTILLLSM
ncbi:MAG TPA: hypothetical protein VFZ16_22525, partial [Hyphomicrobiaceae bacterium]|nr:hypothetical protein [Hyphomicrobiaceae bacterium]